MAERAHVSSVDALEAFRSQLIVYLSKARPALDEVGADVVRLRNWIEGDQRVAWEGQLRRRTQQWQAAQQALFSARISTLKQESSAELLMVQRARRAVEDAEAKLKTIKLWARDFDNRVQPLVKQIEKLHTVLSNDMVQAVAHLAQVINSLQAYADVHPEPAPSAAPSEDPLKPAT